MPSTLPGSEQARDDAGLRLRAYRGAVDHPAMVAVVNASHGAAGRDERETVDRFDATYAHLTNCDPARDIVLVERGDAVAAYARTFWRARSDGRRTLELIVRVEPAARGLGIEERLVEHALVRADELRLGGIDPPLEIIAAHVDGGHPEAERALDAVGFALVRRGWQMTRPDLAAIPDLPLPAGIEIRPIDPADDASIERVRAVDREVFADAWGEGDDASAAAEWAAFCSSATFDPTLWRVAFDGDEICGQVLNYLDPPGTDGTLRGWTESIAVREPWRRRGLASALLAESLRAVRERGAQVACLTVDAQNPNEAARLYRRFGFEVRAEELEFHRRLGPGLREELEPLGLDVR